MRLEIINNPASEPVLLDEFKDHLRLDGTDEDAALGAFISTARSLVEEYLDIYLVGRSTALYLDKWLLSEGCKDDLPWWSGTVGGAMSLFQQSASFAELPVRPVSSIDSISIVAPDGSETTWAAENYLLIPGVDAKVTLQSNRQWPVPGRVAEGIKIILTMGFGPDWNHVPASLRQAVLMLASYLYGNRGDMAVGGTDTSVIAASGAASLLAPYRGRRL